MTSTRIEARYEGWNSAMTKISQTHAFIRYSELLDTFEKWASNRVALVAHINTILTGLAGLGKRPFFGRKIRFGATSSDGDILYVDLDDERFQKVTAELIISLQAVIGEGRSIRHMKKGDSPPSETTETTNSNDAVLSIANKLQEMIALVKSDDFLASSVFTADEYEARYSINWSESSR